MQLIGAVLLMIGIGCAVLEDIAATKGGHSIFTNEVWRFIKCLKWGGGLVGLLLLLSS